MKVSLVTATYNRADLLWKCYKSLKNQSVNNFEWIIVDDGSNDHTKEVIARIEEDSKNFIVKAYTKINGGKHTAINFSLEHLSGEVTCILDSDDTLIARAVENIIEKWNIFYNDPQIGCISFLKGYTELVPMAGEITQKEIRSNHIKYRINKGIKGDFCEVIKTSILKETPFPLIADEKFMSEGWLWTKVSLNYDTVYIGKVIYIADYLEDGLTLQGRALRLKSPEAGRINSIMQMNKKIRIRYRIKQAILYNVYSLTKEITFFELIHDNPYKIITCLTFPLGFILSKKWNSAAKKEV